jgi:hypothetical protein
MLRAWDMKTAELLRLRLRNQLLTGSRCREPRQVVSALVAMQAQEYAMSKWAIALRMAGAVKDADIERAFNAGEILRTHVLRPTWHFVAPEDIRWLLSLTAPRVHVANGFQYRQLDLNAALFKRSNALIVRALEQQGNLTRVALQDVLAKSRIKAAGPRLGYLMMHAELEALICSGPRAGKQFTYALLQSRAPDARALDRQSALAELSRRYFASRGPATAQDFATWSGLTLSDARAGVESLGREFERENFDGRVHVFQPATSRAAAGVSFLMPDYDEYGMSYKERGALRVATPPGVKRKARLAHNRMIVVDGRIVGSWRRSDTDASVIETDYVAPPGPAWLRATAGATRRFMLFSATGA